MVQTESEAALCQQAYWGTAVQRYSDAESPVLQLFLRSNHLRILCNNRLLVQKR